MVKFVSFADDETGGILSRLKGLMNWKTLAVIVAVLILLFVLYKFSSKSASSVVYKENFQDAPSNKVAEIMLFYVDWCPHCKTAKPEWQQVKTEMDGKNINGYKVIFTEVNCTEETAENEKLMNTYKIQGYPTIKLIKDGQVVEFDAKPTKSSLTQFLNTAL
jgi:hypothetical protein